MPRPDRLLLVAGNCGLSVALAQRLLDPHY